jgi:predicted Zn-dependent protease
MAPMQRRFFPILLILTMLCASIPAPAFANTSTATEVEIGKEYDKQIVAQNNVVTDPLLNAWVDGIGDRLWAETARKDVPYSVKILDVADVNAFSTMGGFIYLDAGVLDFAQSDDEMAGVMGHETGHIERRHALQNQNKASIIGMLLTLGSIFNPLVYRFGQLIEAGAMAKISRDDEYQADKYGLMLMTRAGYDPNAMVTFMQHLGAVYGEHNDLVDKYLADHPDEPKRVAALVGYAELDPKYVTEAQRQAFAIHDQEEGRYAIASREFAQILKTDPANDIAEYHLGETQLALGQAAKGEQNLSQAAAAGTPETRTLAEMRIKQLRAGEARFDLMHVDLQPLRDQLVAAQQAQTQAAAAIETRRDSGRDQLKLLRSREDTILYGMPDISQANPKPGSRLDTLVHNIGLMSKALTIANAKASQTINGVGSVVQNKEGGLLKENAAVLNEMSAALNSEPLPPLVLSTLPYYPRTLDTLSAADADMVRALDAARASLALLDVGLGDLDAFVRQLQHAQMDSRGDISMGDYNFITPSMNKAVDSLNRAAVAASQSAQLFDMVRARQLIARVDLLGLASGPDRYATLQHAIDVRFHNATIDYATMLHDDLSPGQVLAASIVAADTNATPEVVVAEAQATHRPIVDLANDRNMSAFSLEVFLGLVYLDYTDDPDKEQRGLT